MTTAEQQIRDVLGAIEVECWGSSYVEYSAEKILTALEQAGFAVVSKTADASPASGVTEEQVARIINPSAFTVFEGHNPGQCEDCDNARAAVCETARAVLALIRGEQQ